MRETINHPLFFVGHSEETKRKISENKERARKISKALKGKPKSNAHRLKMSESMKGRVAWNKGLRGEEYLKHYPNGLNIPTNKGKKHSRETRDKIGFSQVGKKVSLETRNRQSVVRKLKIKRGDKDISIYGRDRSPSMPGKLNPMYGIIRKFENSPAWIDGRSFLPYPTTFSNRFKMAIRKRDNYICLKCNRHQEKEGKSLSVHHIDYDKMLTIKENCCAVCNRCNSEVNGNRKHWLKFFQSLLSEKYGYKYENDKPVIELEILKWKKI